MMASAMKIDDVDVMECPICNEVFTDPRVLPCGHTCCFSCIKTLRHGRPGVRRLPCPFCRQMFTLHNDLPKNYLAMNFLEKAKASESPICGQHADEKIQIYCIDCKMAVCSLCVIQSHNGHRFSDVSFDDLRKRMTSDAVNVTAGMDECRENLDRVEKKKNDFLERCEVTGVKISKRAEQLKLLIDAHRDKLMNGLSSMKQKRMKEVESPREEIEKQLSSMKSYKKHLDEVMEKGSASEIAKAATESHDQADELLKFDVVEGKLADLGHADVAFTPSYIVTDDAYITFGHLHMKCAKTGKSS